MDKSPDAFRTISEVAEDLDVPQHVLRFWETRFAQIKPLKRGGGRRYYRPDDVDLLRGIRQLLYGEGYTIKGVQRILKEEGPRFVQSIGRGDERAPARAHAGRDGTDTAGDEESETVDAASDEPATRGAGKPKRFAPSRDKAEERDDAVETAFGKTDIERLKAALADLTECERVLGALAACDEAATADKEQA